jgi:hypothetical protein
MHAEKYERTTISSILRALEVFDGCEVDVRMTKDRVLVIHHDAGNQGRRLIETDFKDLNGISTIDELIQHARVIRLINEGEKTLWVEAKEDSSYTFKKDSSLRKDIAQRLTEKLSESPLNQNNIRIISFCAEILTHVKGIQKCLIVPYLFSPSDNFIPYYNHMTILQMFISLRRHMQKAKRKGFNGLLFSKHYLRGFFSLFQPRMEKILSWKKEEFILGTEAQTLEEEKAFEEFVVITDYRGERGDGRGERAGPLICHRGL